MSAWNYEDRYAPPLAEEYRVTLGEGGVPCIPSRSIGPDLGIPGLWFQLESANPTGSYKDRFAALAISHMRAEGVHTCLATSSGNTGAALAAYCAVAGIRCRIAVVETAPLAKLQQMLAYGAEIERVRGFGLDEETTRAVFDRLASASGEPGFSLQISAFRYSPLGMQGVQGIAWELRDRFPGERLQVFSPAGGGGLTLAVARGFHATGGHAEVHCVQPAGNDTIAGALRDGDDRARPVQCSTDVSGLQVADVIDGDEVVDACRESGGTGHLVTDEEVFAMQARLAREEGVFAEPAGAVALAGAAKAATAGELDPGRPVVCLVTGTGFKDAASVERMNAGEERPVVGVEDLFL